MDVGRIIERLRRDGYCKLPGLYKPHQVERALELVRPWADWSDENMARDRPYLAKNDRFVWNLQNKDFYFLELLFAVPELEEVLKHFLNDPWFKPIPQTDPNYILRSYLARNSDQRLPLHIDSFIPYSGAHVFALQASIVLEEQTADSGCTVVVPGSHLSGMYCDQDAFERAIPIESAAGDVVIWDSRVWHGALENTSGRSRWSMIATFMRWWIKQSFEITRTLPQEIYQRLSPSQKAVLGFCSAPWPDEAAGLDMKRGYDALPEDVAEFRR